MERHFVYQCLALRCATVHCANALRQGLSLVKLGLLFVLFLNFSSMYCFVMEQIFEHIQTSFYSVIMYKVVIHITNVYCLLFSAHRVY